MKLGFYPGCSMHGTAREYRESLEAIAGPLGIELEEVRDWSCCGASSGHQTSHLLGVALAARNLSLAEEQGHERLLAPCAACYGRLAGARHELQQDAALAAQVGKLLTRPFANAVGVINAIELLRDIAPAIKEKVSRPLQGLKVACYYGCQIVRPERAVNEDPEVPMALDQLLEALGAVAVPYPPKVRCCGGMLVATFEDVAAKLCDELVMWARQEQADCIVTTCPLCHANLELLQERASSDGTMRQAPLPIVYFTQLIGMALGCSDEEVGLHHNFVPLSYPFPLMAEASTHV